MTEKKDNFMLKWNEDKGQFVPIESDADMNEGIFIELVDEQKWRYFYIKGASLLAMRAGDARDMFLIVVMLLPFAMSMPTSPSSNNWRI